MKTITNEQDSTLDTSRMSPGQRETLQLAEAAREAWGQRGSFAAGLFMGRCDWPLVHPFPTPPVATHTQSGKFLRQLEELLVAKVDPDEIDRTGEIPATVIDELAAIGAFGIKIEEEYGGLGLTQTDYCRAAELLGSWCGNTTALISAHQSIGVPQPLRLFGTEKQKREFLPRLARGEISAFALTEREVGSDPARMKTHADPTPDGREFILNGEKLWCTNGTRAGVIVVMARTPSKLVNGQERPQITAFIVEMDRPGITVTQRCRFLGLRALYNAVIKFENVRVPQANILLAEGKGLRVALTTLNTGRLTLPAACAGLSKRCLQISRRWALERQQWGGPIGHHAAVADKIARMAANTFAMEAMTLLTAGLVDRGDADIRVEAAMAKMFGTEAAWQIVNDTLQIRGGRGYETAESLAARGETPIAVERFLRDSRINTIFEGSSEIMRLFIAREALDQHLKLGTPLLNKSLSGIERFSAGCAATSFYARWYPRQWLRRRSAGAPGNSALSDHVAFIGHTSRQLARRLFHTAARRGPKLEREQLALGRFVEIGTDLFAMAAVCARAAQTVHQEPNAFEVADYFCQTARQRIAATFRSLHHNTDRAGYRLARRVLEDHHRWLETGIVRDDHRPGPQPRLFEPG